MDEKLKPLSVNEHTVTDSFGFVDDLQNIQVDDHSNLVSYDVSSLFTNVPVDETIKILAEKAFKDDWFNKEHGLHITKADLVELLNIATKNQLFQFERNLHEQVDGVAMGSPLGSLWPTHSCVVLRNDFKTKAKCRNSTDALWTTLSA